MGGQREQLCRGGWQLAANSSCQGGGADWLLPPTQASSSSPPAPWLPPHGAMGYIVFIHFLQEAEQGCAAHPDAPPTCFWLVLRALYLPEENEALAPGFQRAEFTTQVNTPRFLH